MKTPLPAGFSITETDPNYPVLEIKTEFCTARLALHGAHLTHWQPEQTPQPVLYTSPTAVYREGKAIRGGVPLCWPWFNAHPTQPEVHPSHGVARNRFWELESATLEGEEARVTLTLPTDPAIAKHVPFPYQLKATFALGRSCTISLATTNLSDQNIPLGGALHTYLAVSNSHEARLQGLQNTPFLDTTSEPNPDLVESESQLAITREVDRIYYGTANPIRLVDEAWKRTITIAKENSLSTVIWNPGLEKATALSDLPDEGYLDFICVEATNARHDTRIIAPGKTHCLVTKLSVIANE